MAFVGGSVRIGEISPCLVLPGRLRRSAGYCGHLYGSGLEELRHAVLLLVETG